MIFACESHEVFTSPGKVGHRNYFPCLYLLRARLMASTQNVYQAKVPLIAWAKNRASLLVAKLSRIVLQYTNSVDANMTLYCNEFCSSTTYIIIVYWYMSDKHDIPVIMVCIVQMALVVSDLSFRPENTTYTCLVALSLYNYKLVSPSSTSFYLQYSWLMTRHISKAQRVFL